MSQTGMQVPGRPDFEGTVSQDLVQTDAFGELLSIYTYRRMEDCLARARFQMDILKAYRGNPQLLRLCLCPGPNW